MNLMNYIHAAYIIDQYIDHHILDKYSNLKDFFIQFLAFSIKSL